MKAKRKVRSIVFAGLLLALGTLPLAAQGLNPRNYQCGRCERIANAFIRADISPIGSWVLGTTAGDPGTPDDDDTNLLYGFQPGGRSRVGSGFLTVHIEGSKDVIDHVAEQDAVHSVSDERIDSVWELDEPYRVRITQTLELRENVFSGRPDVIGARYSVSNVYSESLSIGLRLLLDVKLGGNDGAPYFIPGLGTITREASFVGDEVPAYWLAFESPTYDPAQLRSIGILRGKTVDTPDRLVIARWPRLQFEVWDYAIAPTASVTEDSAVALFWNPVPVAPGETVSRSTEYGIPGNGGDGAFLSAPVRASCGDSISVAMFVSNFDTGPLTGGSATITLPPGLRLASGHQATKALPDIAPRETGSAVWAVDVDPGSNGIFAISAAANFSGGLRYDDQVSLAVDCSAPPTTPPRPPSPTPPPADACALILNRVPAAAISAALANPEKVHGWGDPANPALPPGPNNPLKGRLSLRDIGKAYHPLFNSLVFKAGCP